MCEALIGLGSNLGDREIALSRALRRLEQLPGTRLVAVSEMVETEPWGVADQPPFANAVACIETSLSPDELLVGLKDIEVALGRVESERYGPRVIDLDILLLEDRQWHSAELDVPHPRLGEREFALVPLLEVMPDATWPGGAPFDLDLACEGRIIDRLGDVPGYGHLTVHPGGR